MGEAARQPGCPELAKTPLELLTPRPGEGFTAFQKYWWPIVGGVAGLGSSFAYNIVLKRPFWAGLHRHILAVGGMVFASLLIRDIKFADKSETDEVYKHYISLHPEDFPPYERKRYAEVYLPFEPYR